MFKLKNLMKYCITLLVCITLVGVSHPRIAFAALEPSNGSYKIKCVGTGQYLYVKDGGIILNTTGTTFKIEDTEPSASVKWFSISYGDKALSFSNKDANAALPYLISGSVNYGQSNYTQYTQQRFKFGSTASGYNIHSIAYGNNTDKRVLTVENSTLCLRKANGSRNQIFTLEMQ